MKSASAVNIGYGGLLQRWLFMLLVVISFVVSSPAMARRINGGLPGGVLVPPANAPAPGIPAQFDLVGYLEKATVDPTMCPNLDPRLWGGTAKINGQTLIIPCNLILQYPAFSSSWADMFTLAPKDIMPAGSTQSGLALGDTMATGTAGLLNMLWTPVPGEPNTYNAALPGLEFHVVGNTINGQNIVGLMDVSQQSLNAGQGVISCIDYATGELQIGGTPLPHGSPCPAPNGTFARVRMNDPIGRYGIAHGGPNAVPGTADVIEPGYDPRFTADTDNPTMHSALGYPVCIPAFNPFAVTTDPITGLPLPAAIDAKCPIYNRPIAPNCKNFDPATLLPAFGAQPTGTYCTTWVMDMPGAHALKADATDPTVSAPLVIGDVIGYHGTLKADANGPYMSAHTIDANLGIYTQPHVAPSYVFVEALGVGTGGGTVGGVAVESTTKVFWVGFSTDPTELVDFYSLHQDPQTGVQTAYLQGTFDPCCVPLGRFRSPVNNLGVFGEPQRNYQAVSRTNCQTTPPGAQLQTRCMTYPPATPDPTAVVVSKVFNQNGLAQGQYTLPNFEFIFGENLAFGGPIIPANLQDIPFLFCGSGPLDGPGTPSPTVGQLTPAPWALPMADPVFHATLCPSVAAVGAAAGGVVTPPPAKLPAVINSVTATPNIAPLGKTTVVALAVAATDPNTPPVTMSYGWTVGTLPAGVSVTMSCGICLPNASSANVTATLVVSPGAKSGPVVFTTTVSNGITPATTATTTVSVPVGGGKAPNITKTTAPGSVLGASLVTISATGTTNPNGGTVTFSFKQTSGPAVFVNLLPVPLGQTIPSTFSGTAAAGNQTGTAVFAAPIVAAKVNMVFLVTETDVASGLTTTQQVTITLNPFPLPDAVAITSATWRGIVSRVGAPAEFGKFNLIATSNASVAPPAGMTMSATMTATLANGTVSAPVTIPLLLTPADLPGTPAPVCGATPCWVGFTTNIILDATGGTPGVFVAPDTITIKSSLGGTATVLKGNAVYTIR